MILRIESEVANILHVEIGNFGLTKRIVDKYTQVYTGKS